MGFIISAREEADLNVKYEEITSSGEAETHAEENLYSFIKMCLEELQDFSCSSSQATGLLPGYLFIPKGDGRLCISVIAASQKRVHH